MTRGADAEQAMGEWTLVYETYKPQRGATDHCRQAQPERAKGAA